MPYIYLNVKREIANQTLETSGGPQTEGRRIQRLTPPRLTIERTSPDTLVVRHPDVKREEAGLTEV